MKRKTTKEILAESFRELAADRAIDKITVQEIVSNCAYSSATFYRHFKDKYDLIAWDYAQNAAEIMNRLNEKDYIWGQVLLDWAAYFQQEKEYLMNLLLHTSGHDAFIPDALFSLLQKNRACVIIVLSGDLFFYPCSFQLNIIISKRYKIRLRFMGTFHIVHMGRKNNSILFEKRIILRMTQREIADRAHITVAQYSKFESGERNIMTASFQIACRVIEALEMDPTRFFHNEYVIGEEVYHNEQGRLSYVKTGRPVDEDVTESP